jgi:hypothetical protein
MRPVRPASSRLAFCLLTAIAAGGTAGSARAITPEEFARTPAAAAYRAGNFAAALAETDTLLRREPRDPILLRVRGMSLYRLNRHAEAAEALKSAVAAAPQDPAAHFWLGAALLEQKDFAGSIRAFETVGRLAPNTRYSEQAKPFLEAARAGAPRPAAAAEKPWSVSVTAGAQYDSNVALTRDDTVGSFRLFESISGAYTFALPWNLSLTLDGHGYGSHHFHSAANDYDLILAGGGAILAWRTALAGHPARLSLGYAYERTWQQGVRYADTHTVSGRIDAALLPQSVTTLRFAGEFGLFAFRSGGDPPVFSRDAARFIGELRHLQYFTLAGTRHYVWGSYAYESTDADGANFDAASHAGAAGLNLALPLDFSLDLGVELAFVDYIHYVGAPRRRAFKQAYLARLNKRVSPGVTLTGSYAYTFEDSNIALFEYRRHVATLSATFSF